MTRASDEAGHNIQKIIEVVKSAHEREMSLERQIKAMQEQKKEIRDEVKNQGIKMRDYDTIKRLCAMEDEDRTESMTNLQICYEALSGGKQLSFFEDAA